MKVERRFAVGLAYTFAYSFSRSMGEGSSGTDEGASILAYSPAWYNRGRTSLDYRHVEFATVLWEVPFGHGRKYFSAASRLLDGIAGGWNLSVTQQARSGAPLSISGGTANLGDGDGSRANVIANPSIANPSPAMWFNTAAFAAPALYTWGSAGMGILDGPGLLQFNTALSKQFRVTEGKRLEFRWEAYNALNRVNYNNPSTNLASSQFGRITSAGTARYMQLALRFSF
jgi:hypothetical protein